MPPGSACLGPTSRLTRLVEGTAGARVTLAVDPAVFGPAVDGAPSGSSDVLRVLGVNGVGRPARRRLPRPRRPRHRRQASHATPSQSPTSGAGGTGSASGPDDVVTGLADQLATTLRGRTVVALPYADADVAATSAINPTNSSVRSLVSRSSVVSKELGKPVRADLAWPVDGLLPAGREKALQTIWAGTTVKKLAGVVVDQRAITDASPYTPTARRVATGGTRLLGYDPRLSALLPKRSDPTPVLATQRYLAESLVLLGERAGTPRSALVVAPRTYNADPQGVVGLPRRDLERAVARARRRGQPAG